MVLPILPFILAGAIVLGLMWVAPFVTSSSGSAVDFAQKSVCVLGATEMKACSVNFYRTEKRFDFMS